MVVDQAAEPDGKPRRHHQVEAADHSGDEHRARLEESPEHQGEPDREVGHVLDQVVGEDLVKGTHFEAPIPARNTVAS
jgi:hypothetical protein